VPEGLALLQGGGIELAVDGLSLGLLRDGREFRLSPDSNDGSRIGSVENDEITLAILNAFRTSRTLTIRAPEGAPLGTVSLDGAAAAMLGMDERQARLGTRGAIARPGNRPDADVPAPPALPTKPAPRRVQLLSATADLPSAVRRLADEDVRADLCEEGAASRAGRTVARLNPTTTLFGLPCRVGYRADVTAFYLLDLNARPAHAKRLRLPQPQLSPKTADEAATAQHILTGDGLEAATGDLGGISMDYSPECGTFGHWRWTGSTFVLTSYERSPAACRGLGDHASLVIYRSAGE
jgi:hypothetical protein